MLATLVLFTTLLAAAVLFLVTTVRQASWIDMQWYINQINNRRNLIRAVQLELQRLPTAADLTQAQQASGIVWPVDVVALTPDQLRWRLQLPQRQWHQRVVQRVKGQVIEQHWVSDESAIFD